MSTKPTAMCPHCGREFMHLSKGKIPTHNFPDPCRAVCRGVGEFPKQDPETPLWKDDPDQQGKDFFAGARSELMLLGFAVVKQMAILAGKQSGSMQCPLCLQQLRFRISPHNGHCGAHCDTDGCIRAQE